MKSFESYLGIGLSLLLLCQVNYLLGQGLENLGYCWVYGSWVYILVCVILVVIVVVVGFFILGVGASISSGRHFSVKNQTTYLAFKSNPLHKRKVL